MHHYSLNFILFEFYSILLYILCKHELFGLKLFHTVRHRQRQNTFLFLATLFRLSIAAVEHSLDQIASHEGLKVKITEQRM